MSEQDGKRVRAGWRRRLWEVIFEADTTAGKAFDIGLLAAIVISILVVMLESVPALQQRYGAFFEVAEWSITVVFTIEYVLRLISVVHPTNYVFSFFGVVDFLAIAPGYVSIFLPGGHYLLAVRALRLLRIFRVLKLAEYLREAAVLLKALQASLRKIAVFSIAVLILVVVFGTLMYVIEGPANGYADIPTSIYWAIVTLTTVGYGDIAPQTAIGKLLASVIMLCGYAIIAVPTGIVGAELSMAARDRVTTQVCPECGREGHETDATYCKYCGARL
jgi:voltage-gated potassium channel